MKAAIAEASILVASDWNKALQIYLDKSQSAMGGTITHLDEKFQDYSKKVSNPEASYNANDRELLSLVMFLERFRCYLEGLNCDIFTDKQVIKYFLRKAKLRGKKLDGFRLLGILEFFQEL